MSFREIAAAPGAQIGARDIGSTHVNLGMEWSGVKRKGMVGINPFLLGLPHALFLH